VLFRSGISVSDDGRTPMICDMDSHRMDRARLVKTIRWWAGEAQRRKGDDKRAVFDLRIDEAYSEVRTLLELAKVIRQFNDAAKEAGSPDKVVLLVSIPGLKVGKFPPRQALDKPLGGGRDP
jgi:hypothetical protein